VLRFTTVDAIKRPRRVHGIDFGAERFVLARLTGRDGFVIKELCWRYAHHGWHNRVTGTVGYPPQLELYDYTLDRNGLRSQKLHEGGRLSKTLLAQYANKIDTFFGCAVSKYLHPRKTIVVNELLT
jgi:hypothetical protein